MPAKQSVVQDPVLVLEALQERVLANRLVADAELVVCSLTLLLEGVDSMRETSSETKGPTFRGREPSALVEAGMCENAIAAQGYSEDSVRRRGHRRDSGSQT